MRNNAIQNAIKRDMDIYGVRYADCAKVDRTRADELEQIVFWPDEPCFRGHLGWRYTKCGKCVACHRQDLKRYHHGSKEEEPPPCMKALNHMEAKREAMELSRAIAEPWEFDDE